MAPYQGGLGSGKQQGEDGIWAGGKGIEVGTIFL